MVGFRAVSVPEKVGGSWLQNILMQQPNFCIPAIVCFKCLILMLVLLLLWSGALSLPTQTHYIESSSHNLSKGNFKGKRINKRKEYMKRATWRSTWERQTRDIQKTGGEVTVEHSSPLLLQAHVRGSQLLFTAQVLLQVPVCTVFLVYTYKLSPFHKMEHVTASLCMSKLPAWSHASGLLSE